MKMCKKGSTWITMLILVLSLAPSVFAAEAMRAERRRQRHLIFRNQEALGEKTGDKFESAVTLSLQITEKKRLLTDVVFVLDKSTSAEMEQQALNMLNELKAEIAESELGKIRLLFLIKSQM